jgi:hypothetical protein
MATANELGQASTAAWLMSALGLAPAPIAQSLNRFVQFNSGVFNLTITNVETLRAEGRDDLLV